MMSKNQQSPEKSISERISELMVQLDKDQLRFAVACLEHKSKKDAALSLDMKPDTVYRWNGEVDELVSLMALDETNSARAIRKRNLVKAMAVKAAGLDSDNEQIRQRVASELIDWELGRPTQYTDITSAGEPITFRVVYDE